jgi:DNA-binding transcriptional LysR family regulator
MQGLQQFIAFAETAKHGGFAAAAREQGVAPSDTRQGRCATGGGCWA